MPFPTSSFALAGTYSNIQAIGQGAYGKVYRAIDNVGRTVAVKEVLSSMNHSTEVCERFKKEVRIHACLNHPNIIKVYQLEEDPSTNECYLICEYANGGSLANYLQRHAPLDEALAIRIAIDICSALEETSKQQIVHCDIKPANILLIINDQGQITQAKLADFGVAKDLRAGPPTTIQWFNRHGHSHPCTPEYMAPEQADIRQPLDVRTDLYALGICLWEMLTGKCPTSVHTTSGAAIVRNANPHVSEGIAAIIAQAVQEDRSKRFPTAQAMRLTLQDAQYGRPLSAPPTVALQPPMVRHRISPVFISILLTLAVVFGAGGWWLTQPVAWSYEREGEDVTKSTGVQIVERAKASNGEAFGPFGAEGGGNWLAQPDRISYTVDIPRLDALSLTIHYSKNTASTVPIEIFLDKELTPRATFYPTNQHDWNRFAVSEPINLGAITKGQHTISFVTEGQQYGVADVDVFALRGQWRRIP